MKKFWYQLDRIYAIPGWLSMRLLILGFKTHPWKKKKISLNEWVTFRTSDMRVFDMMFWASIVAFAFLIYLLFFK